MTMTLLQAVQEFCDRRGLDRPSVVMASMDDTVRQLRALANEVVTEITNRGESWPRLQKQALFTTVATELQDTILNIAPYGFKYLRVDTIFDRTERRPLFGPRNGPMWQESEALPVVGPLYTWRIWQGNLYIQPAPPADHEIAFEYASDYAILAQDGVTWKKRFSADTDSFALDEDLLLYGLNWKWRREQGLSYAQEKMDFEALLTQAISNTPTKGTVSLDGGIQDLKPGIWVPAGNWPVGN